MTVLLTVSCGDNAESQNDVLDVDSFRIWLNESPDDRASRDQAAYRRELDLIAECMANEGFRYPYFDEGVSAPSETDEVDVAGLGISTQAFPKSSVGPTLSGVPDDLWSSVPDADPEEEYLESLTESEVDAYQRALHGPEEDKFVWDADLSEDENRELWLASGSDGGCTASARSKVLEEYPVLAALASASKLQSDIEERIDSEQDWLDAQRQSWSCVNENGRKFSNHSEVVDYIQGHLNDIYDHASITGQDISIDAEGLRMLADLQREEKEIASTLDRCQASRAHLEEMREEIRRQLLEREIGD